MPAIFAEASIRFTPSRAPVDPQVVDARDHVGREGGVDRAPRGRDDGALVLVLGVLQEEAFALVGRVELQVASLHEQRVADRERVLLEKAEGE